jgi:uncharacterized membrane protein AbrB (regulator of aidB expression)
VGYVTSNRALSRTCFVKLKACGFLITGCMVALNANPAALSIWSNHYFLYAFFSVAALLLSPTSDNAAFLLF